MLLLDVRMELAVLTKMLPSYSEVKMEFDSLAVCSEVLVAVTSVVLNGVKDDSKLPIEVATDSALEPALLLSVCDENSVNATLALALVSIIFVCVAAVSRLLLDVRMELAVLTNVLPSDSEVKMEFDSLAVCSKVLVAVASAVLNGVKDDSKLPIEVATDSALEPALLLSVCDENSVIASLALAVVSIMFVCVVTD